MRLTTIGTGTASPSLRVNAGHLIEHGDVRLLLDCGSGVVHRMATLGLDWQGITHVAITHFHPDHILDIPTLFYAWRYGVMQPRVAPLTLIGPPGIESIVERFEALMGTTGELRSLGFQVTIVEHTGPALTIAADLEIAAHKVPHTAESVAYSIGTPRVKVAYTGDTGYDESIAEFARDVDVLLAECSLPESIAIPTHLTPQQCGRIAARAACRHLALTHFFPPVEDEPIVEIVRSQGYEGAVTLAVDGWSIDLQD